jgi:hypothetical protein
MYGFIAIIIDNATLFDILALKILAKESRKAS